jgi:membrane protein
MKILLRSLVDFFRDGGLLLAGSISYFSMMAFFPFCLFLVTIFGYFLGEQKEFYQFFLSKLISFFPKVTSEVTEELKMIITHKGIGKFTLLLYGFLSYQLFSSMESAINVIFRVKVRRSFFVSLILSLFVVTLISAFFLVSFSASSSISMLAPLKELFPALRMSRITGIFIGFVIPFILMFLSITTVYILLPKKRVRLAHASAGALFTAAFLEVAKHVFTLYVRHVFQLGTIYGPLSAFVIFLLWVFYSSCIFLVGAEVVHNQETSRGNARD